MSRMIDADALIAYCDEKWIPLNIDAVNEQPTIEERKTGKWIEKTEVGDCSTYHGRRCSLCGCWVGMSRPNFCPNCGADMRGGGTGWLNISLNSKMYRQC